MSVQPCPETCVNHPLELDICLFYSLASPATCLTTIYYLFVYYLFTFHPCSPLYLFTPSTLPPIYRPPVT